MKKIMAAALGALTLASTALVAPAEARPYSRYSYGHDYRRGNGDAVAAGIAGLAIGAIIGSAASRNSGYGPSYGYSYGYGPRYGYARPAYGYGYYAPRRVCRGGERVWDPYYGRYIIVERNYRC
jgi:hypothetical protein